MSKLVCKRWWQICNLERFAFNEVLFFNSFYKADAIFDELLAYKNDHYNLRFDGKCLTYQSYYFWNYFGQKIVTLELEDCEMGDNVFETIVAKCFNLSTFVWHHPQAQHSVWLSSNCFEKIKEPNRQLRLLEIDIPDSWITGRLLTQIFATFPAIEKFTIYIRNAMIETLFPHLYQLQEHSLNIFWRLDFKFLCNRSLLSSPSYAVTKVLSDLRLLLLSLLLLLLLLQPILFNFNS